MILFFLGWKDIFMWNIPHMEKLIRIKKIKKTENEDEYLNPLSRKNKIAKSFTKILS